MCWACRSLEHKYRYNNKIYRFEEFYLRNYLHYKSAKLKVVFTEDNVVVRKLFIEESKAFKVSVKRGVTQPQCDQFDECYDSDR